MDLNLTSNIAYRNLSYSSQKDSFSCNKEEISVEFIIIYLMSLKTGWVLFQKGKAPDCHWDDAPGKIGKRPSGDHKRGFYLEVETPEQGLMTWTATGHGQCAGVENLFRQLRDPPSNLNCSAPIFRYLGSEAKKIGDGTTRVPMFQLVYWTDATRPTWPLAEDTPF